MSSMNVHIPNFKTLEIHNIVLDFNGTIAKDGIFLTHLSGILKELTTMFTVYVITADTNESVRAQMQSYDVNITILQTLDHTQEKADLIKSLKPSTCIAIGNGNNDVMMLDVASIGICVMGDEGCASQALMKSDIVCRNVQDALELILKPHRLIATLRQ